MTAVGSRSVFASATLVCVVLASALACRDAGTSAEQADSSDTASTGSTSDESSDSSDSSDSGTAASCVPEIADDCMDPNLKCMPWAESMGPPTDHQCCPLSADPVSPGERCSVQDYVHSCIDDCPAGSMCMVDDADTLGGHCHEFCDITDPDSCGPEALCKSLFSMDQEAATPLCVQRCDPLLQDCAAHDREGWSCLPTDLIDAEFMCLPPLPMAKLEYEACTIPVDCAPGLTCVAGSQMLGCSGDRCCSPLCDVNQEPSVCTMGNACVSLESSIPGLEAVGVCIDPSG